ncbi:hypothetical protein EON65_58840 [archaeon]|nr:MAG: hypothetical protein EON65_58840 [archaeon]
MTLYASNYFTHVRAGNVQKEIDKAFETSYTRVITIMVLTYTTLFLYLLFVIQSKQPALDAVVPSIGFNLSTWSLPCVKRVWMRVTGRMNRGVSAGKCDNINTGKAADKEERMYGTINPPTFPSLM